MPTITTRALRGSTIVAFAAIGVLGLAGCSGGGDAPAEEQPADTTSSEESTAPETSEAAPEGDASGEVCSAEQIGTLTSASGTLPDAAIAAATADFQPAEILGSLPTACIFAVEQGGVSAAFAVLPGGAATLTTVAQQATAAGGTVTEAGGVITGSVGDLTVAGVPFTTFTQETAGFENVEDLVVVATTSLGTP